MFLCFLFSAGSLDKSSHVFALALSFPPIVVDGNKESVLPRVVFFAGLYGREAGIGEELVDRRFGCLL